MKKKFHAGRMTAVLAAVLLGISGCGKKDAPADASVESTTQTETSSTDAEDTKATEDDTRAQEKHEYSMLQGTILKTEDDGMKFTLQADDGKTYEIRLEDIRDVETELKPDAQIAIACIGDVSGNLKDVTMVAAFPEQEEWTIATEDGVTTSNAMSTFVMTTDDGRELSFLKDNCPVEEGALSADSGDEITVVYVTSQGMNFPLEILKQEK